MVMAIRSLTRDYQPGKNDNYDDTIGANKLVGMAVYNGGTAINDQTGVININAEIGQAFYNDGSGVIVNYGTICTFGICQDSASYNPTDSAVSRGWDNGNVITAEGETLDLPTSGGVTNPWQRAIFISPTQER